MKSPLILLLISLAVMLIASPASAATYYVNKDGTEDFTEIQPALDAAASSDTIIVRDGTYTGAGNKNLDFHDKAITLRSENGPDNCTTDCENNGRGFYFHTGETAASMVDGFSVINGGNVDYGGGIYCTASSSTITNCSITDNTAGRYILRADGWSLGSQRHTQIKLTMDKFIKDRGSQKAI